MTTKPLTRRTFLVSATMTLAGVALAACGGAAPAAPAAAPTSTAPAVATKPAAQPTTAGAASAPTTAAAAAAPTTAAAASAATTAPAANSGTTGKITWDTFRGVGTPWPDDRIKAFTDANAGWTVEFRPIPTPTSQQDAYPKMYAMYAAGTLGDVFAFDPSHWEFYRAVPKGLLRPIDDLISQDHYDTSQFYPSFIEFQKWNGKMWGLPSWGWSGQDGLVYNQVVLQELGIKEPDHNSPDWTMDSIRDLIKKTTKMGTNGAYDRYGATLAWGAAGATIFARAFDNADFYDPKKSLITDPQVTKAFKWAQDMAQTDKSIALPGAFQGAAEDLFASGKLAIINGGSLNVFNAQKAIKDPAKAVVKAALFPKRKDGKRPSQLRGGTWNIGSKSKNPEAAWKFIQTLSNKEGTLKFNTIGGNGALVRPDIMDDPYFSHPGFKVFLESLLTAMAAVVPGNGRGTEFEQTISQTWGELYLGKIEFDPGIKKLSDAVQHILDEPSA